MAHRFYSFDGTADTVYVLGIAELHYTLINHSQSKFLHVQGQTLLLQEACHCVMYSWFQKG